VEYGFEVGNHDVNQFLESDLVLPAPVLPGLAVVDHVWPGVGDGLAVVWLVGDF